MPTADLSPVAPPGRAFGPFSPLLTIHPIAYIAVLLIAMSGGIVLGLRRSGVFACPANEYGADRYLAYCNAANYADYDHGAFWFGFEPEVVASAARAQVLFIGNSRMQFGLSTEALADWFSAARISYFLLGFGYNGNYLFEGPLVDKLQPAATVYVINLDLFFDPVETPPAKAVLHDGGARARYSQKQFWQRLHKPVCSTWPALCGNDVSFFRSRSTGAWAVTGEDFPDKPVSYDEQPDQELVASYVRAGREFLPRLPVKQECVLLTSVPTVNSSFGTARAVATALGLPLVAPELPDLNTFDGSHLDEASAKRWSAAFIEAAAPQIRACLEPTR